MKHILDMHYKQAQEFININCIVVSVFSCILWINTVAVTSFSCSFWVTLAPYFECIRFVA